MNKLMMTALVIGSVTLMISILWLIQHHDWSLLFAWGLMLIGVLVALAKES